MHGAICGGGQNCVHQVSDNLVFNSILSSDLLFSDLLDCCDWLAIAGASIGGSSRAIRDEKIS